MLFFYDLIKIQGVLFTFEDVPKVFRYGCCRVKTWKNMKNY